MHSSRPTIYKVYQKLTELDCFVQLLTASIFGAVSAKQVSNSEPESLRQSLTNHKNNLTINL